MDVSTVGAYCRGEPCSPLAHYVCNISNMRIDRRMLGNTSETRVQRCTQSMQVGTVHARKTVTHSRDVASWSLDSVVVLLRYLPIDPPPSLLDVLRSCTAEIEGVAQPFCRCVANGP